MRHRTRTARAAIACIAVALGLCAGAGAQLPRRTKHGSVRFTLTVNGQTLGTFSTVIGLNVATHPNAGTHGNGGSDHKRPGKRGTASVTLKRGITSSRQLWNWRQMVISGHVGQARRNAAIVLSDEQGEAVERWQLTNAWPEKYEGPALNAKGNDVAIEELTLAYESLTLLR